MAIGLQLGRARRVCDRGSGHWHTHGSLGAEVGDGRLLHPLHRCGSDPILHRQV